MIKERPISTLILIVLLVFVWLTSLRMYPVLTGDAAWFLPPILSVSKHEMPINPIRNPLLTKNCEVIDFSHPDNYNWHGFGMQLLFGSLIKNTDYKYIKIIAAIIQSLILVFAYITSFQIAAQSSKLIKPFDIAGAIFLMAIYPYTMFDGRPEQLCLLLLSIALIAILFSDIRMHPVILGIIEGAIFTVSPVVAIIAAPLFLIYIIFNYTRCRNAILNIAFLFFMSCIAVFILKLFWPFSFSTWFSGMYLFSKQAIIPTWNDTGYLNYWLIAPNRPLLLPLLIFSLVLLAYYIYIRSFKNKPITYLLWILYALLIFLVWYFSFRTAARNYNLTPFSFLMMSIIYMKTCNYKLLFFNKMIFVLFALMGFFTIYQFIAFYVFTKTIPYNKSKHEFDVATLKVSRTAITISDDLFTLTSDYHNIDVPEQIIHTNKQCASMLVISQKSLSQINPPVIAGYELTNNYFSKTYPSLFGVAICRTNLRTYGFAVYTKKSL